MKERLQHGAKGEAKNAGASRWAKRATRIITWEELSRHTAEDDMWITLHGYVYDVTKWLKRHPGGSEVVKKFAGGDATDQFDAFHQPRSAARLVNFIIGTLEPPVGEAAAETAETAVMAETAETAETAAAAGTKRDGDGEFAGEGAGAGASECKGNTTPPVLPVTAAYRALREHLWRTGMFESDLTFFALKDIFALALLLLGVGALVLGQGSVSTVVAGAVLVGLGIQQAAFMAHDALHNGVVKPGEKGGTNWCGWFHGSVVFGVSGKMWLEEHNLHHAITRRPCEDPQFNYLPVWLISKKEVEGKHAFKIDYVTTQLTRVQHYTMIPVAMIIGRFNLHLISAFYALKNGLVVDLLGLALYAVWFGGVVSLVPGAAVEGAWPWLRIAFVLVCYITIGVLHVQLLVNHMDVECYTEEEERALQFFKFQLQTTRNTTVEWYDAWYHGGLENQIEHHLFPQLPRHRLAEIRPLVKRICAEHGVPFRSTYFTESVRATLRDLKGLSTHLMTMDVGDLG